MLDRLRFLLVTLVYGWLRAARTLWIRLLWWLRRRRRRSREPNDRERKRAREPCVPIDNPAFVRPDPLIYDQQYLMKLGLAVTWDNPDVELHLGGVPVSSAHLEPGTTYDVVARIWNASLVAPVAVLPVHFSYLDFGIGTVSVPIGSTTVNLGVIGGPNHPAFATVPWTTPTTAGHYCIQVRLDPPDDLNWDNNLGQENTNVAHSHSPAVFTFTLRNDTPRRHRYTFEVDSYVLPGQVPCEPDDQKPDERRRSRLARHRATDYPVPAGWTVEIAPDSPSLASGESISIEATVTPPTGLRGQQPINVRAFREEDFAGGVTLVVVGED